MRKLNPLAALAALLILTVGTTPAHAEPCEPGWVGGVFGLPSVDGNFNAVVSWDDGSGGVLYVGGSFVIHDSKGSMTNIARWNGSVWSALAGSNGAGVNGAVHALAVFDDGSGPALYVGGEFTTAGGVTANGIARWDGTGWSAVAGADGLDLSEDVFPTTSPVVCALTVYDDGTGPALYAGGRFSTAGGVTVNNLARWDGSAWTALTAPGGTGVTLNGFSASLYALTVYDDGSGPALFAGGEFTAAGGVTASNIARWDGSDWTALESPNGVSVNDRVSALTVFDDGTGPALYAGGEFTTAGGVWASRIARWDGSNWSALDGSWAGVDCCVVSALTVYDDGSGPALYAGGEFTTAGGVAVNRIVRWDGNAWSTLTGPSGNGVSNGSVRALTVFDDGSGPALYVGGDFTTAGGVAANRIARWDGGTWSALEGPGGVGVNDWVYALTAFDDGTGPALYVGGDFTTAGGVAANHIARWDGSDWSALEGPGGVGVNGAVGPMTVFDDGTGPALYAGGSFTTVGGVTVNRIARWDGSTWSALEGPGGVGVSSGVWALTVLDDGTGGGPALYAGGSFGTAGGVTVNNIARWDGSTWSALEGPGGVGMSGSVHALTVFDDGTGPALYAGGWFTTAGGVNIARWDGSDWSALEGLGGVGMNGSVSALTVFDDGSGGGPALYAGGGFTTAGGVTVNRVARWDGSDWSALEGPGGVGVNGGVGDLTVFDDGSGPALYAVGNITTAGGVTVNGIARWDGSSWSALEGPDGVGMNSWVWALTVFDDGTGGGPALFAGGWFTSAGGVPSEYIAKWAACPPDPSCNAADLAEPYGLLDLADIVAFVTAFGAQDPAADLAEPFGVFDLADIVAFVVAFEAGCP